MAINKFTMRLGNREIASDVRRLYNLRDVIYDKDWLARADDFEVYYMYRDLYLSKRDREILLDNGLRYDITVIPPGMLGKEFVKTLGHYHPLIQGTSLSYTEVYEVLEGEAHYILQKEENGRLLDVAVVKAGKGDKVIVPPNYGHVTVNPSNKVLKMANFVARHFSSIYEPYKKRGGAAYFEIEGHRFVKNTNYGEIPELRFIKPANYSEIGLKKNREMYGLIRKNPSYLRFLIEPHEYEELFLKIINQEAR
jgi:glucose-6-phosphate isomerase